MTFEEIIHSFATSDTVPAEAIRAALEAPTAFVDKAIPLLERGAVGESSDEEDSSLSVLVCVLGEIGDERALPPLMRVLALPSDELDMLFGDTITESLGNVLISLAANNAALLEDALIDTDIDDFARDAIFDAWTQLVLSKKIPQDRAKAFVLDYPVRLELDNSDFGWSSWVDSVTALGLVEARGIALQYLAREATITSIIDTPNVTYEDFERQMSETLADPDRWKGERKYQPFTGTIEELSRWYGYSEQYRQERARMDALDYEDNEDFVSDDRKALDFHAPYIASNPYRDVGRNDPCPCGSGKKFKKCCLETMH